jgi:hypothetical protein
MTHGSGWDVQLKTGKMYTNDKIKQKENGKNDLQANEQDIPDNQLNTFHVEHIEHNINQLELYNPKIYNMKKFKATTNNRTEFLFAPFLEQAENMWQQMYPFSPALITEVERTITE